MKTLFNYRLFKNAGKNIAWWEISAVEKEDSSAELVISHAGSPTGAFTPKHTPVKGKNIGKSNETTPGQQAVLEANSRVLKQIDKGYVRTQEEALVPVTNGIGKKKPQLSTDIRKLSEKQLASIDWDTTYLQPKLNGNRGMVDEVLYSRSGNEFLNLGHIVAALEGTPLSEKLHLDGEIYKHDGTALQVINGLIKKKQPGTETLQYWLYDSVSDLQFIERYWWLEKAYKATIEMKPELANVLVLTETVKVSSMLEALEQHEENIKRGFEGSILRWGREGYCDDKRVITSLKLKPFEDHEFKVVDYEWGTPNRDKDHNDLLVPVLWYEISPGGPRGKVTAPGDMYEKDAIGRSIDDHMGRLMTITHMGYTLDGIPDIATAKGWYEPL